MKIACGKKSQLCKLFVGLSFFALSCAAARGQPQQHRPAAGRPPPMAGTHAQPPMAGPQGHPPGAGSRGLPPGQSVRDRWLALPPDARQNFRRNAEIWMQMSPEQRNLMRQRENLRRETMTREAETAVRDSGLQLNPQQRAQFESRYIQERRKVEQALRQQIEAQRQKELPALIRELKKEFQIDQPAKSPATQPAASPKSGK
jgi:hypothetical protein